MSSDLKKLSRNIILITHMQKESSYNSATATATATAIIRGEFLAKKNDEEIST